MFNISFDGLDELIKNMEKASSQVEIDKVNKKALKECGELAKASVTGDLPRSKDVSKSGRKGSRTYDHMANNVPVKFKTLNGKKYIVVGWEKSDNSPYFYNKFIEWGSSKHEPQFIFQKTFKKQIKQYNKIFKKHYEEFIKILEG